MSGSDVTPSALRREPGTPENPQYSKVKQDDGSATAMYFISVDEGWRTWILCAHMYEDKADQLLEVLRASGVQWRDA